MPRHARLMLAGVPVHIVQRGNNRGACFFSDEDYQHYLYLLGRFAPRDGCEIHAYCLMTNHVHLLLCPRSAIACAKLMKNVGQHYAQRINRSYRRSGTLWEGRFRSCLVQSEAYVLACYRYIELNPVRAGMVPHPRDYPWSSYRNNGEGRSSALVMPHPEYLRLGTTAAGRRAAYNALFSTEINLDQLREIREATNGGFALGSKQFNATRRGCSAGASNAVGQDGL